MRLKYEVKHIYGNFGEREKNLVGRCIIQKMKGFQGMVEQSRNDELISSALVIGPE